MDTETAEGQLFFGDRFPPLLLFSDQLRFVVHYRWREVVSDD
nr:hypothetical protein [Methylobacterium sp. B34]